MSRAIQSLARAKPTKVLRGMVLPSLVAGTSLMLAVAGALVVNGTPGQDNLNLLVETLSGRSAGRLELLAPLGFALAAGAAAAFNPCGFAMLPAYMGLYLAEDQPNLEGANLFRHLGRSLLVGVAVTAGFIVLFAIAGSIIGLGARSLLSDIMPWLGLSIGVVLVTLGSWLLNGGELYTVLGVRAASRMGNPRQVNVRGYFLFGVSYGTASLSCTLPIFLSVIGTTFTASSMATSFAQFVLYALGMGFIIIGLTVGLTLFRGAMIGIMRRVVRYVKPVSSWLTVAAGTYIVFYWLSVGGLLG